MPKGGLGTKKMRQREARLGLLNWRIEFGGVRACSEPGEQRIWRGGSGTVGILRLASGQNAIKEAKSAINL
jgi:hypothetical protein